MAAKKARSKKGASKMQQAKESEPRAETYRANPALLVECRQFVKDMELLLYRMPKSLRRSEQLRGLHESGASTAYSILLLIAGMELKKNVTEEEKIRWLADKIREVDDRILLPEQSLRDMIREDLPPLG